MTIFAYTLKVAYTEKGNAIKAATGEDIRTIKIEREQALVRYAGLRPRVIEAKEGW